MDRDVDAMTREELEAEAARLGVRFRSDISDANLRDRVHEASQEPVLDDGRDSGADQDAPVSDQDADQPDTDVVNYELFDGNVSIPGADGRLVKLVCDVRAGDRPVPFSIPACETAMIENLDGRYGINRV